MPEESRWQIAFWVITFLVVGSFGWTSLCAYSSETKMNYLQDKMLNNSQQFMDTLHKIDLRLSRIEYKLGVEDGKPSRV